MRASRDDLSAINPNDGGWSAEDGALLTNGARPHTNGGRELVAAGFAAPGMTNLALADVGCDRRGEQHVIAFRAARKSEAARQGRGGARPRSCLHVGLLSYRDMFFGSYSRRGLGSLTDRLRPS